MECTATILRERKALGRYPGEKSKTVVQLYCPIMGEIVLSGEQAEEAIRRIREKSERISFSR